MSYRVAVVGATGAVGTVMRAKLKERGFPAETIVPFASERSEGKLLDVKAQALRVTFSDRGNDTSFLAAPLPAGTIGKLVTPVVQVKSLNQPFETFGGRMREAPQAFRTRASERLRHKDRAISITNL